MGAHKSTTNHSSFATANFFRPPCSCKDVAVTSALQAVRHLWDAHDVQFSDVFHGELLPMVCIEPTKRLGYVGRYARKALAVDQGESPALQM
jgi:hypothetical protein